MTQWIFVRQISAAAVPWTPSDITAGDLRLWLRADGKVYAATSGGDPATADDTVLRRWEDESGTLSSHPQTVSESDSPVLKTGILNGLPVVRFNGVRSFYRASTPIYATDPAAVTFFAVARNSFTSAGTNTYLSVANYEPALNWDGSATWRTWSQWLNPPSYSIGGEPGRYSSVMNSSVDTWHILASKFEIEGDKADVRRDGGAVEINTTPANAVNTVGSANRNLTIGGRFNETADPWIGDIAEIVVVANDVTTTTRDRVEGYLAHKWGLAGNLPAGHAYKSAAPTV